MEKRNVFWEAEIKRKTFDLDEVHSIKEKQVWLFRIDTYLFQTLMALVSIMKMETENFPETPICTYETFHNIRRRDRINVKNQKIKANIKEQSTETSSNLHSILP